MENPIRVTIYKGTVIAADGLDCIYIWKNPKKYIAISFDEADIRIKLPGVVRITCLRIFKGRVLVGTGDGAVIIFSSPFHPSQDFKTHKVSLNAITSIRLFQGDCITATICSNKNTVIKGKLSGNDLECQIIRRDHLVQDARMIENDGSYKLCTIGLKGSILSKQDGEMKRSTPIFDKELNEERPGWEFLDISEKGLILTNDCDGNYFLRHISDNNIKLEGIFGNYENNYGGVGISIPYQTGHLLLYAGYKYAELCVDFFEPGFKPGKDEQHRCFGWQGMESDQGYISSIDYHEDQVVLSGRRSIIVFSLGSFIKSMKLSKALGKQDKMELDADEDTDEEIEVPDYSANTTDDSASDVQSSSESGSESLQKFHWSKGSA